MARTRVATASGSSAAASRGPWRRAMTGRSPLRASWLPILFVLAFPGLRIAAQLPHRHHRLGMKHPRGRVDPRNQRPLARRRLLPEYEPPPCEWCHERMDGTYADTLATPACSAFFSCRDGQLLHLDACPWGLCFDEASGRCVELCQGPCSSEGAGVGGAATAQAHQGMEQGTAEDKRLRGQHARMQGSGSITVARALRQRPDAAARNATKWMQVNALLAFKHANSDPTGGLANWSMPRRNATAASICHWTGVTCNATDVVELALGTSSQGQAEHPLFGDQSLMQSIPPQFGNLTALTSLDLSYLGAYQGLTMGGLVGPIPSELGHCTSLETLSLQWNALSGSLPDSLSRLQNLTSLNLGYNLFDTPFPTVLTTLASLSYLSLYYVGFSGPIPSGISNLKSLTNLVLSSSPVNGTLPPTIGTLPNLQYLILTSNPYLGGSLPLSLSRLGNLKHLQLKYMNLTGELPSAQWWGELRNLNYLEISSTQISGTLPSSMPKSLETLIIASCSQISGPIPGPLIRSLCANKPESAPFNSLDLSNNTLTGTLPMQLSLCSLGYLFLEGNQLGGEILPQLNSSLGTLYNFIIAGNRFSGTLGKNLLSQMSAAANVNISWNRFTGAVPKVMYAPSSLLVYDVSGNLFEGDVADLLQLPSAEMNVTVALSDSRFSGRVPRNWLSGIYELHMDGNPNITGPLPDPINCNRLYFLDTSRNNFSGGIPKGLLRRCPLLQYWKSEDSGLSGPIPSPGRALGNMQELLLSGNNLSGPLPSGLSLLHGLKVLDVSRNALEGPFPTWLASLVGLTSLDASFNNLTGPLFPQLRALLTLRNLSLSHNELSGSIPLELAPTNFSVLQSMDLSFNRLNGTIPWGFASTNTTTRLALNLSHNQLTGQVPGYGTGPLAADPSVLADNSGLCGAPGFPPCPSTGLSTGELVGIIVGSVVGGLLLGALFVAVFWRCWVSAHRHDPWDGVLMAYQEFDPPLTARDLVEATGDFSDENLLGRGGFGNVYRATLRDGTTVAVKRLQEGARQGDEEFKAELEHLGSLRHRNLVCLLAAYVSLPPHNERLLVYEYLPGGSLDSVFNEEWEESSPYRSFAVRRKICTDIAKGLKYLHHDCDPGIVHCDMKPANVLLNQDLVAHVADFGLAKAVQFEEGKEHMSVGGVFGTPGFVAPEFYSLHRLSFKSDVYAYGVTLVRIMTNRRTTDNDIIEAGLQRWASSKGASALDPNLVFKDEKEREMALGIIKLGVLCTARVPVDRPGMEDVLRILENLEEFVAKDDGKRGGEAVLK